MKPMQMIREECANHQSNGSCLGVQIAKDLTMPYAKPRPRCLVTDGQRCGYFEACVLPLADIVSEPRRAKEYQAAVVEYRQITNQKAAKVRTCPDCGGALQPRKQLCPACAQKRQLASKRATYHHGKGTVVTH
ncbi:MAG: hypothetical protein NTY53_06100 [Kiritimatiellaeota bacterium]|nr:hypothetical protein [Kiritimatiellota bacterium]